MVQAANEPGETREGTALDSLFADAGGAEIPGQTTAPAQLAMSAPKPKRRHISKAVWWLAILLPYTFTITVLAVFFYMRSLDRGIHPLASLADQGLYEELDEGRRRRMVDPQQEIGGIEPLPLGATRDIGDLRVTPLKVTCEPLVFDFYRGIKEYHATRESLVLYLRLENISQRHGRAGYFFHPMDPSFNRSQMAYTYLEWDKRRFFGPVDNPHHEVVRGQLCHGLRPGDSLLTFVATREEDDLPGLLRQHVANKQEPTPLVWRVHLRKGREEIVFQGKKRQVWTTTVVPVQFTSAQIYGLSSPSTPADDTREHNAP
ncbi:MAG: hypothetical protein C4297_10245 [Gemmataceae bacterium]